MKKIINNIYLKIKYIKIIKKAKKYGKDYIY
jgi:hypothetical protein